MSPSSPTSTCGSPRAENAANFFRWAANAPFEQGAVGTCGEAGATPLESRLSGSGARSRALAKRSRAFGCSAYRQSGTAEIDRRRPKMRPTFSGRARGRPRIYEVRTYVLRPNGLAKTIDLWRNAVPGRLTVSPLLAAMYSVTGPVTRFMHIWPYASLDERQRLRTKAVADGVWPPPGGPDQLVAQQADIFLPAEFSPLQ